MLEVKETRAHRLESARDSLLAVLAAGLLLWAASVTLRTPATPPPRVYGVYTLTLADAGGGGGTGKAIITPRMVKIDGTVVDGQGNSVDFSAAKLDMDMSSYRFRGTGSLGGVAVTVSGRIDANDKTLKKCRVTATYLTADGKSGRIVGRKSS
jgi:hypothetical protein